MSPGVHPAFGAALESWSLPLPLTLLLAVTALLYLRGWLRLRSAHTTAVHPWRLGAFIAGLAMLWIAVGSPLVALDDDLLSIHMIQHVLLMGVAPPLILLGAPALPLLHGFPRHFVRSTLSPPLRWPPIQKLGRTLTHPAVCWLAAMGALVAWHIPALFGLALRSDVWHEVEHACFFGTGLMFWWPVVQPWPSLARWPRWRIPLYLFMATLPCDVVSAFLAFCERVVYPHYLTESLRFSFSPLQDQECAGALMWMCATFIYLTSAVVVTVQLLSSLGTNLAEKADGTLLDRGRTDLGAMKGRGFGPAVGVLVSPGALAPEAESISGPEGPRVARIETAGLKSRPFAEVAR